MKVSIRRNIKLSIISTLIFMLMLSSLTLVFASGDDIPIERRIHDEYDEFYLLENETYVEDEDLIKASPITCLKCDEDRAYLTE